MSEGWKTLQLKDLCSDFRNDIVDGPFGANLKREHYKTEGVPVLKIQNIKPFQIVPKNMDYVDEKTALDLKRHAYEKGDIIITKLGLPLGISAIVEDIADGIIVADLVRVRAEKIDTRYLCYHLNAPLTNAFLNAQQGGATRPRVRISAVRELPIHVPPLPEQTRIVSILDEAFEGIGQAVANAEKNLANARELFESYLNAVFTQKGEGWLEMKLGEAVGSVSTGPFGSMLHKFDYIEGGIPIVNPINIVGGHIKLNDSKTVGKSIAEKLKTYLLDAEDIVIGRRGEIGRCAVVEAEQAGWLCGTGCFYLKPSNELNPYFLSNLLRSQIYREKLERVSTGATMKNLSNTSLRNLVIAFPSNVDEQYDIVLRLDELSAETQRLEAVYQQKLATLAELKQSLLRKAFSGELTAESDRELEEAVA